MGEEMIYICIQRELARENNFKILPKHPLSLTSYQPVSYTHLDVYKRQEYTSAKQKPINQLIRTVSSAALKFNIVVCW